MKKLHYTFPKSTQKFYVVLIQGSFFCFKIHLLSPIFQHAVYVVIKVYSKWFGNASPYSVQFPHPLPLHLVDPSLFVKLMRNRSG
jgi:hypothetical protein